jgi:membrane associated rhomboid family serine protease
MLPIRERRDTDEPASTPFATVALVAANVLAFLNELAAIGAGDRRYTLRWGLVPRIATELDPAHGALTVLTSMFLHGGWLHLAGNMLFLWLFGASVERALGSRRFLTLYAAGGAAAAIAQVAVDPTSTVPMIGASGAIGAVLGAYVSLYPFRRIETFIPPLFVLPLPAFVLVGEWFLLNLVHGVGALEDIDRGNTAWWAHIGGFLAGLVLVRVLFPDAGPPSRRRRPRPRDPEIVVRDRDGRRYLVSMRP